MCFLARVDMDQCWRRQDQENRQRQRGGYYDEDIYDFEGHVFTLKHTLFELKIKKNSIIKIIKIRKNT